MLTKKQRYGVFLLLLIIVLVQLGVRFLLPLIADRSIEETDYKNRDFELFSKEIDSLRVLKKKTLSFEMRPFNPNYINDFKGARLGMSTDAIDRLLDFRKENHWIRSAKEFQTVTNISDSLLTRIAPYFKFPEWQQTSAKQRRQRYSKQHRKTAPKTIDQKLDLNTATAAQLQQIKGIGPVLARRIIMFRNTFIGGFIADVQLQNVYGLTPEVLARLQAKFTVKTPRVVPRIDLNTATLEDLVQVQYIDYKLAYDIIEQRTLREGFKSFDDLMQVKGFPRDKIEIIKLYLSLDNGD